MATGAAVVLFFTPAVVGVTSTSTWQEAPAARLATLNWISRWPAVVAPKTPAPTAARDCTVPHAAGEKVTVTGVATASWKVPSGSVTDTPVNAAPLAAGLVSVKRSAVVPFTPIGLVPKLLLSVGGV